MDRLRKEEKRQPLKKLKRKLIQTLNDDYMREVAKGMESVVSNK